MIANCKKINVVCEKDLLLRCTVCKEVKNVNDYSITKIEDNRFLYRKKVCKPCNTMRQQAYRKRKKEEKANKD